MIEAWLLAVLDTNDAIFSMIKIFRNEHGRYMVSRCAIGCERKSLLVELRKVFADATAGLKQGGENQRTVLPTSCEAKAYRRTSKRR